MKGLNSLEPKRVFHYFQEISRIPRCSYDEENISNYIKNVGEKLGLETIQDHALNVIIRKPATPGYENAQGVVLQGHMDMVCEKEDDSHHDFTRDPIELIIEGDFIRANKTTLGADNGIAIAMGLAIMEDDSLQHPALELLVTTSEETGMEGAFALSEDALKGRRLLNLDSEEEGILTSGSAGGELIEITIPIRYSQVENLIRVSLEVRGLLGGHSGIDIDRPRGNANKILNTLLLKLRKDLDIGLISIEGGTKDNAIPRSSVAKIALRSEDYSTFTSKVEEIKNEIKNSHTIEETNMEVVIVKEDKADKILTEDTFDTITFLLESLPTGVNTRLAQDNKIVESSSNLAIIETGEDKISIKLSNRSSSESVLLDQRKKIVAEIDKTNAKYDISGKYPGWEYAPISELRETALGLYKRLYGQEMKAIVIHAGLECGILAHKYPDMDIISFGPDMYDVHTPQERVSIPSTGRLYTYLVELLRELK